uniref:CSON000818 protein n=1 Tax=Culicoides sonorensis TaxID=179676 RepID=A0A336KX09_CULSO
MLNNSEEFTQSICCETKDKNVLNEYRLPPVRPSPGSSPNLQGGLISQYDFDHSAPCSPTSGIKHSFKSVPDETQGYYENSIKNLEEFSLQDDGLSAQMLDCMSFDGIDGSTSLSNNSRLTYIETNTNRNSLRRDLNLN